MNNINVKKHNFRKFRNGSRCSCIECRFYNATKRTNVAKDYVTEEDLMDEDGWI